jgi:phage terminase large subunit-like protein
MARPAVEKLAPPMCPEGAESWAEWIALQPDEVRKEFLDALPESDAEQLEYLWWFWARRSQLPPGGAWQIWFYLAGRGTGKTRTGAQWVIDLALHGAPKRNGIALVGATVDDARDIIIEGESGILAKSPSWFRPTWNASKRTLVWPNLEWARTYSADRPDRLRGKQHAYAWADELAAWRYEDAWDQLMLGLRLGDDPRVCITTTPRATPLVRRLAAEARATGSLVRGKTYENRQNLAPSFFTAIIKKYEGTRLGRQELDGDILDDNPGALWNRKRIDDQRIPLRDLLDKDNRPLGPAGICERLGITKLVVSVDPAVTADPDSSNETGITVVGTAAREKGYLLDDVSGHYSPNAWAAKVFGVYDKWKCDAIIGEVNNGGDLIEHTLRTFKSGTSMRRDFKFEKVHASRGKRTRAEPVAALDEQFRLHHVGVFGTLEDQLTDWDPVIAKDSPDRLDAYVWGVTYLMVGEPPPARGDVPKELGRAFM